MRSLIGRVSKPTPSVFHRETGRFFPPLPPSTTLWNSRWRATRYHRKKKNVTRTITRPYFRVFRCEPTINPFDDKYYTSGCLVWFEGVSVLYQIRFSRNGRSRDFSVLFLTSNRYFRNRLILPFHRSFLSFFLFLSFIRYFISPRRCCSI